MRILSDCPQALAALSTDWKTVRAGELPAGERAAWTALSPAPRLAACTVSGPAPVLVAIGCAEGSQFTAMLAALDAGVALPDGLACLGLEGRGFRGQRERAWQALRGNLHLCVHYRVRAAAARVGPGLTALPAVAAAAAIRRATAGALAPRIKWVNDLLVDDQKVGGVLTATRAGCSTIDHVVYGIGINVAVAPPISPAPPAPAPGRLGRNLHWSDVLAPLLDELDRGRRTLLADGSAALVDAYRADSAVLGRTVRVWPEDAVSLVETAAAVEGRVAAIDDNLALHIEGVPTPIRSGRLALLP